MPECVEAETTRRILESNLAGSGIRGLKVFDKARLKLASRNFSGSARLVAIRRHGKILMFDIAGKGTISISMGMSGSLVLVDGFREVPSQSVRLELQFSKARCLFVDPRRLGRVSWDSLSPKGWDILGAVMSGKLSVGYLSIFKTTKSPVKVALMNQDKIAGLGNVYANEILFRAGINPTKGASNLGLNEARRLVRAARDVLSQALARGGISMRNYVHPNGHKGNFQKNFLIYGRRKSEPCPQCSGVVRVIYLGQRSTFFCPRCQK